ncbi:AbrB/MazE/SpoVT family DNA-binding domain-containing protein [Chromatium okenii]|jgi:AbrB family looped-hinge helix DNA binding protein|uniref:AbrB family transcriptional regulator n=1 Tax=Chromatium okenii TaxID=61644 RepID=A0A2S7XMH2_9GAMM|nr:AbrB/MazE/SpoVT family DNA-binding domain-containing protein [Chromatium okenii]MBK1641466.1 AbrB family transcriptional regulator [Chromatium okenii]MBV5310498.1 AbrB/MazE/SpoVT family DNA-binding domain-containing protein [Chromatium okenii]PQJ94935.1 AbrB family transcriptional regulator [Chromatium okenii]
MNNTTRITNKGQVTIPKHIRELAGLLPEMEVEFRFEDGRVILEKTFSPPNRVERAIERLRRAQPCISLTTDDILDLTRGE